MKSFLFYQSCYEICLYQFRIKNLLSSAALSFIEPISTQREAFRDLFLMYGWKVVLEEKEILDGSFQLGQTSFRS